MLNDLFEGDKTSEVYYVNLPSVEFIHEIIEYLRFNTQPECTAENFCHLFMNADYLGNCCFVNFKKKKKVAHKNTIVVIVKWI